MYTIEKNLPIPKYQDFPWKTHDLSRGDSFVVALREGDTFQKLRTRLHRSAEYYDYKITVRRSENAYRVWIIDTPDNESD